MIWDEFLRHFHFCDEEDSGLSDEEIQNSFLVLKMKLFFEQIARFCAFVVLRSEEITVELVIGNQKVFLSLLSTDINKGLS